MRMESVGEWGIVSTMLSVACASRTRVGGGAVPFEFFGK